MSIDEISWNVVDVVFAGDDPAVGTVFPHGLPSREPRIGWEISGAICPDLHIETGNKQGEGSFFTSFLPVLAAALLSTCEPCCMIPTRMFKCNGTNAPYRSPVGDLARASQEGRLE